MTKSDSIASVLPEPAHAALQQLGQRLRAHRIARGWSIAEMAQRLLCSPNTWKAMESGKPGTSIGVMAHALWLLGQIESLDRIAPVTLQPSARRVRRAAGSAPPGRITGDELDF